MVDTVLAPEKFRALVQPLIGLTVALPWKGYGSAIFLELGELLPLTSKRQHHNKGEACISVKWDWRVENGTSVLYGSSNSRPKIEHGIGSLLGTAIQGISIAGQIPELAVQFSNGHCLRSMVMVSGDPEWSIKLLGGSGLYTKAGRLLVGDGVMGTSEEEDEIFALAETTAARWGIARIEPVKGMCRDCANFVPVDGEGHLLDYGACISSVSPLDGRIINRDSGCPYFAGHAEI